MFLSVVRLQNVIGFTLVEKDINKAMDCSDGQIPIAIGI